MFYQHPHPLSPLMTAVFLLAGAAIFKEILQIFAKTQELQTCHGQLA